MKKLIAAPVAFAFLIGTVAFAQAPAQENPPKVEKGSKKTAKKKTSKRKAEQPKAQ